jgi:hypothetical protein
MSMPAALDLNFVRSQFPAFEDFSVPVVRCWGRVDHSNARNVEDATRAEFVAWIDDPRHSLCRTA